MDPGLIGTVCAACWLGYRYRAIHSDIAHQTGRTATFHTLAVGIAGISFLTTLAMCMLVTLALAGSLLGPSSAALYSDGCTLTLGLLMLSEAANLAYMAQSSDRHVGPRLATARN